MKSIALLALLFASLSPSLAADLHLADYSLKLDDESGVAYELRPKTVKTFDLLPSDRLTVRKADRFVHLGDISLRVRQTGGAWTEHRSFTKRVPMTKQADGSYDLDAALPDCPLRVIRRWTTEGGRLALVFEVSNPGKDAIEIGALGIPMPFNNIIRERSLVEAHAKCSFTDPYIGQDAGYLRVTQLNGIGPTMIVTPLGKTPLEAWQLVREPMAPNQVFEGMMEWMVHTRAYADQEWKGVTQWNEPTSALMKPGESRTYGVRFSPASSIRGIEDALIREKRPVAVGLPGYVLPMDQEARLFLRYGQKVTTLNVEPKGSLTWTPNKEGRNGWAGYTLKGKAFGRSRLTVDYADGTRQTVSYYVIKPAATAVADMGRFLTTKAWFTDKSDPFGRAPSAISYDREEDAQVVQDSRVWIAGLGDEGGSGNWLALAMKAFGQPNAGEVAKLESFIDGVLWGHLQFKEGPNTYGVRKSVFYYDPKELPTFAYNPKFNWTSWTSWTKKATDDIGRGYNYPHVVSAYWAMYRVARNHPEMAKAHPWTWYLEQAYRTTEFLTSRNDRGRDRVGYWRLGLMNGSVFGLLLDDLKREGWTEKAALIESRMKLRADRWKNEAYPFGSEMPWDSTGQEEVYNWCKRFGYEEKAQVTLNSILAYNPTVPHWGYNGNARRYWDFLYGGKLSRIERQIHHYGSGLNAIPVLNEYREHPDDLYLLRVGYGGTMGALSNIDQGGFASAAFHSFPSTLKWDAYSGDYGPNFFGHAYNTAAYLVDTKDFGWQGFGGRVSREGAWVKIVPLDSFRSRVFLAPVGLYLTLDSGAFQSVSFNPSSRSVRIAFAPGQSARLRLETTAKGMPKFVVRGLKVDAGAFTIPVGAKATVLDLRP